MSNEASTLDIGELTQDALPTGLSLEPGDRQETQVDEDHPSVFGSFWIDNTEFALPVEVIREMVGEPDSYAPVPLSPQHMLGVFNLRDTIIPVIDLRVLLDFAEGNNCGSRKIAIIENGEHCIGLLFDDAGGVISNENASRINFEVNSDGVKDVVVEGMLKLDGGKRMVQILNPYELLNIEKLPRVAKTKAQEKTHLGQRLNCISFQLGHTRCALDLRYVQEITDVPDVTASPLAHGHILGNIELRGQTMPIIDFRGMMGNAPPYKFTPEALKSRKLLILSLPSGYIGLLVYSIDSIMTFFESDVLPFANVSLPRQDIVAGCLMGDNDEIVILLDHQKLFEDAALLEAAQSCREIFPSKEPETEKERKVANDARSTFILFSVEVQLAFDISCVSEILNLPEKLLQPPYALDFVNGILNLRGDLITLINPRVLYDLQPTDLGGSKVLIFQNDNQKYGMVVNSVDEIVTISSNSLMDIPSIARKGVSRIVSEDVAGCIRVPSRGQESEPVLVMDVGRLIERCVDA